MTNFNCRCAGCTKSRKAERERILNIINERLRDLESCTKLDDCQHRADGIRLALSDIEWKDSH